MERVQQSAPVNDADFRFADLKIRTKDKRIITFDANAVQQKYLDILVPEWREGDLTMRGNREIILKARQFGFSTLILALMFLDTVNTPNTQTVVIAHDSDSTERLFQMVQRFYKYLPEDRRPVTKYANRREYLWPEIESYFFVGTAGSGEFGRGGTINNVHASEVAFWPDGESIMAGLMQAVPADGNVFLESTANGVGNYYYEEYQRARSGESSLKKRFFAWFDHPEYTAEVPVDFEPTPDEEKLAELYGLSAEQITWRRNKLREPGMAKKFVQEYPANEDEAFIASGNPYFDNERLMELAVQLKDKAFDPVELELPEKYVSLKRCVEGLQVWKQPEPDKTYVIGADTSEGLNDEGDHDYDSASVWEVETGEQVAHLHGRWNTHLYGLALADLGFWYNTALLGIERNNHGHAVINAVLYTAHYPEAMHDNDTGLYMHQEYDEKKQPTVRKPGYPTTVTTKYLCLDEQATAVEEGSFHPRSRELVGDMMRFVKKKGGKAGGEGKTHDDRVMDAAIARRMLNLRPKRNWKGQMEALKSRAKK